jgi:hypothetical protein
VIKSMSEPRVRVQGFLAMNPTMTAEPSSDAELVEAARRQEPGAYGELFRRWYDRSYDVALNILRDREAAADVAQDAFLVGTAHGPS